MSAPIPEFRAGYRSDLDGLRGVAVGLVVVYHVWFGRVSGGVDVFLCLSGYFFGAKMIRTASDPFVAYPWIPTVTRLVRRLFPALVTSVAGCVALATVAYPYTRYPELRTQVLASLGYFQNIHLERFSGDYLAASASASPLQHLWSMSVQGQFFVAVLIVVGAVSAASRWAGRDVRAVLVTGAAAAAAGSFVYAALLVDGTGHGYYNGFARAWELLAGVLAGAFVGRIRWSTAVRDAVGAVGLLVVVSGGLLVDGASWFPGPAALVPVSATLAVLLSGANLPAGPKTVTFRVLASKTSVWLGTIAYCLYLWHWPLLVFWLSFTGNPGVDVISGTAVIAVSVAAAWVTARYVESPLRASTGKAPAWPGSRKCSPAVPVAALAASVVVTAAGAVVVTVPTGWASAQQETAAGPLFDTVLDPAVYPGAQSLTDGSPVPLAPVRPSLMEARQDVPVTTWQGCIDALDEFTITECRFGAVNAGRTVALAGGSHSEHWIRSLDALGRAHGFTVVTYLKVGCPLSVGMPGCGSWPQRVLDRLVRAKPDFVFTTSTRPRENGPGDEVPPGYLPAWRALSDSGIPILAMRDTPWMNPNRDPADCLAMGGTPESCGRPRSESLSETNPTLEFTSILPMVFPLDVTAGVCRPHVCRVMEGNVLVYRDPHHLSDTYVASLTEELWRQMSAATGWG